MSVERKWLVFYTKSRSEKKAQEQAKKMGYEVFLPLQTVIKQWSDRKKKVQVPLFNSYIFIRANESEINDILQIPGLSWNIRHNGKPAVVRDIEIALIKRFIETGLFVETGGHSDFSSGDKVEVIDGPLRGTVGYLTGDFNDEKFTVIMDTIDQSLTIRIRGELLKKLDK